MTRRYASAGAIVTTGDLRDPRILLLDQVRKTGERQTVAPKGRLEPGEAPLLAAVREVIEEAGVVEPRYGAYLGRESYAFTDNDDTSAEKTVDWFLVTTPDTATTPAADEGFVAARWLDLPTAREAVSHGTFRRFLDRAAAVIDWRASAPLPFSSTVDAFLRTVATDGSTLLAEHDSAGIGVCGSAARGDFVEGWSDIDLIAWNLTPTGQPAQQLRKHIGELGARHRVRASLHLAGTVSDNALHDMKAHAVLRRVGIDTAVIAGAPPAVAVRVSESLVHNLQTLYDFAVDHRSVGGSQSTVRRVLSVLCSGARQVVAHDNPTISFRLPDVTAVIAQRWPDADIAGLLRDYDAFRRGGCADHREAGRLADRVPSALSGLIRSVETASARS